MSGGGRALSTATTDNEPDRLLPQHASPISVSESDGSNISFVGTGTNSDSPDVIYRLIDVAEFAVPDPFHFHPQYGSITSLITFIIIISTTLC